MGEFQRTIERIQPLGWHLDLHFDAGDLPQYDDLLQQLPVPFIIDHMGRVPTQNGLDQEPFKVLLKLCAAAIEKCWVKISGAERIAAAEGPPFHRRRAVRAGAHRSRRRIVFSGAPTGRTRTSPGTCPTMATWST